MVHTADGWTDTHHKQHAGRPLANQLQCISIWKDSHQQLDVSRLQNNFYVETVT